MAKKSDYLDPRTNLFELLPEVFQSQTNEAVFEDVFNRYLSKPQIELVDGFAGAPLDNATQERQITEPTPHRQLFQLQPLLFGQVGNIDHLASYVDILNEVERYGVDSCRLPLWGNALKFNWAPPVDIDKLVNFRDYYWFNEDDPTSPPQYITIENPCIDATQRVEAYQETVDTYGDAQEIIGLTANTFVIEGDLTAVFTDGYVFFVQNSLNPAIDASYFTTALSTYNVTLDQTTITVDESISDLTIDGDISLQVYLDVLESQKNCACGDDVGWDFAPWDDNQVGTVLWASGLLTAISHPDEADWITNNPGSVSGSPPTPADLSIWYDTTNNQLKQYLGTGSPNWNVVQSNFSAIVAQVEGTHFWDYTVTCDLESNPWTDENMWYHKNHVTNFAVAKQAELPIIEYDFSVQLNRWTFTDYVWQYRESDAFSFAVPTGSPITTNEPTLNELTPFNYVINPGVASPVLNKITLSPEYGDQTAVFENEYRFIIENDALDAANNGTYIVESSSYATTDLTDGDELATIIIVQGTLSSANQSATSAATCSPMITGSGGQIAPFLTSLGDFWQGYYEHWLLDDSTPGVEPATGTTLPVPTVPPTINPAADIDYLSTPFTVNGVGEYLTSTPVDLCQSFGTEPYVLTMQYTVLPTIAPGGVSSGTVIPFDSRMIGRAPIGESIVRVEHNGQQLYGTFTELDTGIGGSPIYVGSPQVFGSPRLGVSDGFVDSLTLSFDLAEYDLLMITVAEQATEDLGRASVLVRTVADDTAFDATGSPLGSQPETISLIQYRRVDPLKTETNEYPLFDLFDCEGTALNEASELFKWRTSQDEDLNPDINLRIVGSTPATYEFENLLIDPTDLPRPVLYTYKDATGINLSVWRKGLNDEEYVPSYVGATGSPVTVGSSDGAWELPDQLYFNTEHENRQYITFPEFITHFRTILDEQNDFPGVVLSGSQAYLQVDYNFGLGGKIKEHNDSYDTFLSSAFVNNVTPLGIVDFAHDQYESSLNTIKEFYRRNLLTYLTDTSLESLTDFQGTINTAVISAYELNDFFDSVYGDSNTFIAGSPELGIRNWPATLPFVGLGFKVQPYIFQDDTLNLNGLFHHDGHRSSPTLTATTRESVIQILLSTPDPRVPGETFGVQQSSAPPDLYSVLETFITPRAGIYWYEVVGGVRTLYRFEVTAVSLTAPSGVPVGSLWYDTSTDLLRELQSDLSWDPVEGSPSEGIITQAWVEIDFNDILVNLLFDVEEQLYEAAPTLTALDFNVNDVSTADISCPTADTSKTDADTADTYLEEAFSSFLRDVDIDDPYSADQFYVATDAFTWNYSASSVTTTPKIGSPSGEIVGGWWTQVYQELYGTPYPHIEPWILQGYTDKPSWWDSVYLNDDPDVYGTRRWKYVHSSLSPWGGMWESIRTGVVPVGQLLPDGTTSTGALGQVQTWNYFSVNIDNVAIDGFDPDELFPPFWDYVANGGSASVRSVFFDFAAEIVLPSADYTFETGGPVIFSWEISSQRLYDDLTVGFRMQPVRFMHSTFGVNFIEVGGLQVNQEDCKVYSHRDVVFHGDIINTNEVVVVDGINQWYVNFNRFNGYDVAASDFRPLWQDWEPQLSYQFASIIDTETLQISNSNFDITERDYRIILKRSPGIDDFFLDAFNVKVLTSPNKLARFDTQHLWNFQVDTFFPTTRSLSYYEVNNYPVHVDDLNNTFKVYRFNIVDIDINGIFFIEGDQTAAFTSSQDFIIASSTGNNGSYTATSISYSPSTDRTSVIVTGTLDPTVDGHLTATYRTIPWETGDRIELTSSFNVPGPLVADLEYFVIKIDDTTFQLASTYNDALADRNINLLSEGSGQVYAGEIFTKFKALDGGATNRVWNHYALDTRFTRSFVPPQRVTGVQNLINVIDGYAKITEEAGWIVNLDAFEMDPDTGRPITWDVETERFIDQAFRLPQQRAALPDNYPVSVDPIADTFTFNNDAPVWQTGTKVSFTAGTGALPTPLVANQTYYVISTGSPNSIIQVALTSSDAIVGTPVNIIGGGSATISVFQTPASSTRNPSIEINPFRGNLWIETEQGILSNIVDGPTDDIRNTQLITDQRREQLTGRDISVFRWDKIARIYVPNVLPNPDVANSQVTPYNTLHMSSIQAFIDGYESIIMFNDYATDDTLIYDPFVGLNTARFNLQFFRQDEFTQRPAIGGYFLTPDDQIIRNIESNVLDLQHLYDTNVVLETTDIIEEGRRTLGYRSTELSFLDNIGLNPKSKFLFWRGMIQNKGSVKAVDAFTNSVNFDGAVVDEYWAYRVADFGSNYEQEYPALNLVIDDSRRGDKRFQFLQPAEDAASTFEGVLLTNQDRWHKQPDVLDALEDNDSSFYFNAEVSSVETFTTATANAGSPTRYYIETSIPFDDVVVLPIQSEELIGSPFVEPSYTVINSRLLEFNTDPVGVTAPEPFVIAQTRNVGGSPLDSQQFTSDNDITTWAGPTSMASLVGENNISSRLGLAYNGSRWVSVGFGVDGVNSPIDSAINHILISDNDGVTWTEAQKPSGVTSTTEVAYGTPNGSGLFVITAGADVLSSPDGATWTSRSAATTTGLDDIKWTGEEFVAVGDTGASELVTSTDGITWTIGSTGGNTFSAFEGTGSRWVGGQNSVGDIYVSTDKGTSWLRKTTNSTWLTERIDAIAHDGSNTWVAVGATGLAPSRLLIVSTDNAETWTQVSLEAGSPFLAKNLSSCIFVPGYGFVAGGSGEDDDGVILTSADGLVWTERVRSNGPLNAVNALASKYIPNTSELRVYTICPDESAQNPAKIIDVKDDFVVHELPFWDPRRGHQYAIGENVVTLESTTDPATYTNALDNTKVDTEFWNVPETGTTWWDISEREYVPYNDSNLFGIDDRIEKWGKLSDWSNIDLYQWTESDVPPSEYDALAATEELNISIDPLIRKTGRVKAEILQRERFEISVTKVYPSEANTGSPQFPINTIVVDDTNGILVLNDRIVFTSDDSLPIPLTTGVFYYIVTLDNSTPAQTQIQVSLTEEGSVLDIKPGAMIIDINGDIGSPGETDIDTNPTGLVNDFNTAGIQNVTFSVSKSLGSSTGLTLGTSGYQAVDFDTAVSGPDSTGIAQGTSGSHTIPYVTSCATATPLAATYYELLINIDGVDYTKYILATAAVSYVGLAGIIGTQLIGQATASCETSSAGIVITSLTSGVSSQVIIDDTTPGAFFTNLMTALSASATNLIGGGVGANYEMAVSVNSGTDQSIVINAANMQTFNTLIFNINSQLTGATSAINGGDLRITSIETGDASTISITDVDLLSSIDVGAGSPTTGGTILTAVPGTSVVYQSTVAVDGGGQQDFNVTGDDAQTLSELINVLNDNIGGATAALLSGDLRITSNSTGSNSSIDLLEVGSPPGLFFNLSDVIFPFPSPVDGVDATSYTTEVDVESGPRLITIIGNEAQNFANLITEFNSQLPTGVLSTTLSGSPATTNLLIDAGTNTVTITNDDLFDRLGETFASPELSDGIFFNEFIPQDTGDGSHVVVPPFNDDDWIQLDSITKNLYATRDFVATGSPLFVGSPLVFDATVDSGSPIIPELSITAGGDDTVDIYINGSLTQSDVSIPVSGLVSISGTDPHDYITIRKERHTLTDEQAEFDPDVFDDGSNLIQYKEDFNYSLTYRLNESGVQVPVYHYWIEDKTVRDRAGNITLRQATADLESIPTPYMIVDNLQPRLFGVGSPGLLDAPRRYTQLILRGLAGVIDDQDRYVLRFTRDFTLRDDLQTRNYTTDLTADFAQVGTDPLDLKTLHTEWTLIREKQPFNIPRDLWDKVTESMIALSLTDSTSRVPSLSRELYDVNYNANTRYGLGDGQAFVDGELALATLLDDLQDPDNDFSPIDINVFFTAHDFETEDGLVDVMDDIYNTFSFESVNRLYFKFVQDAFTTQPEFADLFKTSWVALQGTQIFQTEDQFTG